MAEVGRKSYRSVPVRWFWFHWINAVCILLLVFLSFVMLYRGELGMPSFETKIALKKIHAGVGYVFVLNLLYRIGWSLIRDASGFWRSCIDTLTIYKRGLSGLTGNNRLPLLGRISFSRLAVLTLFLLMATSAVSGLYRAGSDLYYPPLGGLIQKYLAKPGDNPDEIIPRSWAERKQYVDKDKLWRVDLLANLFGKIHRYSGYAIMSLVIAHLLIVSKMFRINRRSVVSD